MKLQEKLVYLRKQKGLSQLRLSEMMEVSRQAISRWETGVAIPSLENLKYLSELYNISVDYLLDENGVEPENNSVTVETIKNKTPITDKGQVKKGKNAVKVMAIVVVGLLILITIVFVYGSYKQGNNAIPIDQMPKEEVEIKPEVEFDLS